MPGRRLAACPENEIKRAADRGPAPHFCRWNPLRKKIIILEAEHNGSRPNRQPKEWFRCMPALTKQALTGLSIGPRNQILLYCSRYVTVPIGYGNRKNNSDAVRLVAAGASPGSAGRSWQREFRYEGWRAFRESLRAARLCAGSTVERFLAGSDRRLRCESRWLR